MWLEWKDEEELCEAEAVKEKVEVELSKLDGDDSELTESEKSG